MHGMLPSQRKLQSVCTVWQRVLHDCTLALAVAPSDTNTATTKNRIELLTLLVDGRSARDLRGVRCSYRMRAAYFGPVGPRAVPPS